MKDLEKIYDDEISPLMTKIIEICENNDMPFYTVFNFQDYGYCKSFRRGHAIIDHIDALQQCISGHGINIDKYIMWLIKSAKKVGHSSIYLQLLDVPCDVKN